MHKVENDSDINANNQCFFFNDSSFLWSCFQLLVVNQLQASMVLLSKPYRASADICNNMPNKYPTGEVKSEMTSWPDLDLTCVGIVRWKGHGLVEEFGRHMRWMGLTRCCYCYSWYLSPTSPDDISHADDRVMTSPVSSRSTSAALFTLIHDKQLN